jgi:predicted ATPase/DNA-binding SARP family transcriptional activator
VHGPVAALRRALACSVPAAGAPDGGRDLLVTGPGGYVLDLRPEQLDADRFEELLAQGRRLGATEPQRAADLLARALALWRGPALAGLENRFAREAAARWEELRAECTEARLDAELALGHHRDVVAGLGELVGRHPFRERLWAQLALALYRCGRQAEALDALRAVRRMLAEELGVAPGPDLRELEGAVLRHSSDLDLAPVRRPDPGAGLSLPAPSTPLVGRVRERDEIAALLTADRLVTLTGPGGSGKTRLAVEVGRQLVDRAGTQVWFVDLAPLATPDLVDGTVAGALGVRAVPGEPLARTVAAALSGRPATLLLDNCEHLVGAVAAFVAPLVAAAPDVRVLCTSREALHLPGEQVRAVLPLATADRDADRTAIADCEAVQLFARRARAARPGFAVTQTNARLVLEVCRRLDGLPLALELAATRAASMPLADLLERLDDRFRLLDDCVRVPGVRHRGLAATLAWSTGLLDEPARRLFARVSLFPAAFALAAAEDVAGGDGLPRRDVALLLARLVTASLVHLEEGPDGATRHRLL